MGSFRELYDLDALMWPDQSVCAQLSSYDREGGNDDGFSGKYSFVRKEGEIRVLFEEEGPGCIYRIWSANPPEAPIRFYFDGSDVPGLSFDNWKEMFVGERTPFVEPFSRHFIGGWCCYVPIPFARSCRVEVEGDVRFYQITWRKFSEGTDVMTYGTQWLEKEIKNREEAKKAWTTQGVSFSPISFRSRKRSLRFNLVGGESHDLLRKGGKGIVRQLRLKADAKGKAWRRGCLLQIRCDGEDVPYVNAPIGDFFLDGFGNQATQSLALGMDDDEIYYCLFPIPFQRGIQVSLVNEGGEPLDVHSKIHWERARDVPPYRFYAAWHRENPTTHGEPFSILKTEGKGHWVGVSVAMQGKGGLGFLEGDEMLWVDGRAPSHYNGTGSEDYYNGGWYFGTVGWAPLYGCGYLRDRQSRCHAFRLQIPDRVPFQKQARITIEHGPANDVQADYAGMSYWYGEPGLLHNFEMPEAAERLVLPFKQPGVTEVESLPLVEGEVIDSESIGLDLSNGQGLAPRLLGKNGCVAVQMDIPFEVGFTLTSGMVKGPSFGEVDLAVDGVLLGKPKDLYFVDKTPPVEMSWSVAALSSGKHTFTWKMVGRGERSNGYDLLVDHLKLSPRGLIEGEKMERGSITDGAQLDSQNLRGQAGSWSEDAHLWFRPQGPGSHLDVVLNAPVDGDYSLSGYFTKAGDYGLFRASLNGTRILEDWDGYADSVQRSERIDLGEVFLKAGKNLLRFEVTGKNEASTGYMMGLDCFLLRLLRTDALRFEGEFMTVLESSGGPHKVQDMAPWGEVWSRGEQLWFTPGKQGSKITLELPVSRPGNYAIKAGMTRAPDYATVRALVNGKPLEHSFEGYIPGDVGKIVEFAEHVFGMVELTQGLHELTFVAEGKDSQSQGFMIGVDAVELVPER